MQIPDTMAAVLLNGYGELDQLEYRTDVPVPVPKPGQVLVRVAAASINNTDINTRLGWYARSVASSTGDARKIDVDNDDAADSAWSGQSLEFPRIQGADVCGQIVAVASGVATDRVGDRVLVIPMQRSPLADAAWTLGADGDGGYAGYTCVNSVEAITIDSTLNDIELASFPCAYSTAENLLEHAGLKAGEHVLITGASGGVGSAAIQLAARRGAQITAVASTAKHAALEALGAHQLVPRSDPLLDHVDRDSMDVVIDVVAGPAWPDLIDTLRRGGRYAVAGAIAGPMVELDVRTLYLKDLTFLGRTLQTRDLFKRLVGYIEQGEIRPLVAASYALKDVRKAQLDFMAKEYIGKIVLVPEHPGS